MKSIQPRFIFGAALLLLASCSDTPTGKFQEENKTGGGGIDTVKRFVNITAATEWQNDWSKENIVVYHWRGEPDNLHPTNGKSNARRVVMDYTQRFLVSADLEKLTLRPDLVKAMPAISADGLTYSYELREEPTWDDGSPLTVEDVIFTIKANKNPLTSNAYAKPYFEYVTDVVADPASPRKFRIVMREKYIQNIAVFGDMPIMQRKFFDPQNVLANYTFVQLNAPDFSATKHDDLEKWSKEFNDAKYGRDLKFLPGLGAYRVTAWEDKQRIELTKKENHWTSKLKNPDMYDQANPEKIIFKVNGDDNSIALELKQQTIDVSTWISTHGLVELQKDPAFNRNYHSEYVQNFNYQYIGMNMKPVNRPPFFVDKRVRRAMALLIDIDQVNNAYIDGKAVRMASNVLPTKPDVYDNTLKPLTYDLEQAKKLLDEAGWVDTDKDNIRDKMIDGIKVNFEFDMLIISANAVAVNIGKEMAENMKRAGVIANVKTMEVVTFYEQVQLHKFDMYFGAWSAAFVPEDYKQIWHTSSWEDGSNYVGFGTSASDALIDSIRVTMEDSLRIPMEKRLQHIVYDEQPYIFLFMVPTKIAIHKRFDNADMYYEKPGVYLSHLRLLSAGTMAKNANP